MDAPEKRRVTLSAEHVAFVDKVVANGEFASDEAVVDEALRDWKERRDNYGYTIAELRRLVDQGIRSGPAQPGQPIMERLKAKYRAMAERADAAE